MNDAELKLIVQYARLIPERPISLGQVIERISKKFNATPIEYGDIPNLWMHRYNAIHLPKNEQMQLTAEQLKIKAIKIPINEQVLQYTVKDFTPVLCGDVEENFIYLAYEEQVDYRYSNSNRLYLEAKLMQGISQEDIYMNTETAMDFFFFLKSYDALYENS